MATKVRIREVDTSAVLRRFRAMIRRSSNFASVFRWALRQLQDAHASNFDARGTLSGSPWAPLDPQYAAWKLENYGADGILVREGTLRSSLTDWNSRGAIRDIGVTEATFGTNLDYAKFHQMGTRMMPSRPPVFTPRTFSNRLARAVGEHVVYGGEVGSTYTHLKAALFT